MSHIFGVLVLLIAIPVGYVADLLEMGILTTVIMLVVSIWEGRNKRLRSATGAG
jgi:low temperature requirement protein LtrA